MPESFFREAYRKIKAIRESHFAFSTSRVLSVKKNTERESAFVAQPRRSSSSRGIWKSFCSLLLACRRTIAQKCAKRNTCILFAKKKTRESQVEKRAKIREFGAVCLCEISGSMDFRQRQIPNKRENTRIAAVEDSRVQMRWKLSQKWMLEKWSISVGILLWIRKD